MTTRKLTAEQVREAVMSADRWEKPMGNTGLTNTHLIIRDDGWQAIADELNLNGTVNGTADGTPTGHVPMDDGTVPIDELNAERGAGLATSYGKD